MGGGGPCSVFDIDTPGRDSSASGFASRRSFSDATEATPPRAQRASGSTLRGRVHQVESGVSESPLGGSNPLETMDQNTRKALLRGPFWCFGRRERIRTFQLGHIGDQICINNLNEYCI